MSGTMSADELLTWLCDRREQARAQTEQPDIWDTDRDLALSMDERVAAFTEVIRHVEHYCEAP